MRIASLFLGTALLIAGALPALAEEAEGLDWTLNVPAGFSKKADSCEGGG